MQPIRFACVMPLAMLALLAAGCSSGGGVASGPDTSQVAVAGAAPEGSRVVGASARVDLEGVRFAVRVDPG